MPTASRIQGVFRHLSAKLFGLACELVFQLDQLFLKRLDGVFGTRDIASLGKKRLWPDQRACQGQATHRSTAHLVLVLSEAVLVLVLVLVLAQNVDGRDGAPAVIIKSYAASHRLAATTNSITSTMGIARTDRQNVDDHAVAGVDHPL